MIRKKARRHEKFQSNLNQATNITITNKKWMHYTITAIQQ